MHFKFLLLNLHKTIVLLLSILIFGSAGSQADTLTVAVASNFAETLEDIVVEFEKAQAHKVRIVRGSSGKHYAQIINGAPFDLFLSADSARPDMLVENNLTSGEKVKVYAIGRLVLWAPLAESEEETRTMLIQSRFNFLSLANPKLAPYGLAAYQTLVHLGLAEGIEPSRLLTGENIAQAYQFVASGNADLGFVALSQVLAPESKNSSVYWLVPKDHYEPIYQKLAILKDSSASDAFSDFLFSKEAQSIIVKQGYLLP